MTKASKKDFLMLERVFYIYYPILFKKDNIKALINSESEVNIITPVYTLKKSLKIYYTDGKSQKIDDSTLETFRMILASFQVEDRFGQT